MTQPLHEAHFDQVKQYISFTSGADNTAPDPTQYPVHVLTGDTFLYQIDGGFPTGPADPFVTDPVVYPSSDYWETLLEGDRLRPFIDLSISEYNTLRLPSSIHDYDLYCDKGLFYEDVEIQGKLLMQGGEIGGDNITIPGDISCDDITCDEITANQINGAIIKGRLPILTLNADYVLKAEDTGTIINVAPSAGNVTITLPSGMPVGTAVTVNNTLAGKTTTFPATLKARGNVLSEQYSGATIYWDGSDWFGFGDLV